jgi:hypothetical protein
MPTMTIPYAIPTQPNKRSQIGTSLTKANAAPPPNATTPIVILTRLMHPLALPTIEYSIREEGFDILVLPIVFPVHFLGRSQGHRLLLIH